MSPRPARQRIRIGELARRSGVSKATIQHYVAAGLLPRPKKTGRTMAYYDLACVDRIRLIKDLQARYLPLAVIRKLIGPPVGRSSARGLAVMVEAGAQLGSVLEQFDRPVARAGAAVETGLDPEALAGLERIGLVAARREGDREVFGPHDVAILRAVARLNRLGLDERAGFRSEDLLVFRDAMASLMAREVELFARHALAGSSEDLAHTAAAAALGATELIAALHRKLVVELIAATVGRRGP